MGETEGYLPFPKGFDTLCQTIQKNDKSVVPSIVTSTTYQQNLFEGCQINATNPTKTFLECILATLNKAKYSICFSSGVAAITALLSTFDAGDHIILPEDINMGVKTAVEKVACTHGIETSFISFSDMACVMAGITHKTKLLWAETPSIPILNVTDLCCLVDICKRKENIVVGVDNSCLTPYFQRPIEFGADIVMHSVTNYVNGHTDVIMGSLCMNDQELYNQLVEIQNVTETSPSPFDCYQVLRSIRSLPLRMQLHNKNALCIANYLETHPSICKVIHPGLASHPQHELFKAQTSGHSGILSFYLKGEERDIRQCIKCLRIFAVSETFGGCESTIELPYFMSQACASNEYKDKYHITKNFIRMSVGLENVCDLISDIEQGLDHIDV